jgi:hypothetical protein
MTISSTVSERSWPGNGSAKQFDFDGIDCNDDGDFRLWITDDTTLVQTEITTNYSISLNADQQNDPGGTLMYPVSGEAVPEGETLTLERSSPFTQETDLQEGNAFEPEVIEEILDQAARERQELLAKLNRAAIIPRGSAYTVDEIVSLIASAVSSSQNFFDTYQDALNEIADLVLAGEVSIQELLLQATIAANHLEEILLPAGYDTIGEYIENVVNMLTLQAGAQYYNPDTVYNPTGRTAPSFVYGSDGATYVCVGENVQGDDPVGSVTGNWVKVLQEVIDAAAQALAAAQAAHAAADAAQDTADAAQDTADAAIAAERYERECTSLLFDGYYFKMYPSDRNLMFQAFFTLVNGLATSIHWKCENGWYELTPSNVTALYAAVQTQVESAFAWEEAQITALEE